MPQEFHVLRCYKCDTFQCHIMKKSKKWDCKMCGERQSLMKVYGEGTGKECRLHVQKLNALRMKKENETLGQVPQPPEPSAANITLVKSTSSKWSKYLPETVVTQVETCDPLSPSNDSDYVLELPLKGTAESNKCRAKYSSGKRKAHFENEDNNFPKVKQILTETEQNSYNFNEQCALKPSLQEDFTVNSNYFKCSSSKKRMEENLKVSNGNAFDSSIKCSDLRVVNPTSSKWNKYLDTAQMPPTPVRVDSPPAPREQQIFDSFSSIPDASLDNIFQLE